MVRIALFGGTFDPFHLAHLRLVNTVSALGKYDEIIVMPTGPSPHKERRISFAGYRYETARLALCVSEGNASVSDTEIVEAGASYTIRTVRRLKKTYAEDIGSEPKIDLLIGSDSLLVIENWYQSDLLLKEVDLLVAVRGNGCVDEIRSVADNLRQKHQVGIEFLAVEPLDISSTEIRAKLIAGERADHLLPAGVNEFLSEQRVFSFSDAMSVFNDQEWSYLQRLEQLQWPLLDQERRVHVLNVMQYAVHLALRHNVDPWQAAVAGLLHDIAKNLPLAEQYDLCRDSFDELHDKIVHAPASAVYVSSTLGISDEDICSAIRWHTTAHPQLGDLGKIIYLADKIEFGREFKSLSPIREIAEYNLDSAMLLCMSEVFCALQRGGLTAHPYTLAAYETIMRRNSDQQT